MSDIMTEPVPESDVERLQKEELRQILDFISDNIPNLTSLYFSDSERDQLKEQITLWRWYISHGWFPKPFQERKKPPLGWLLNELKAFPAIRTCVSKLAAPGLTASLDLEGSASVLKHQMRRVVDYPGEPAPIPDTWNLPKSDPRKTDQYGVPWAKSECEAARNWRKTQAKIAKEEEKKHAPPKVFHMTEEQVKESIALKNKQREDSRKRRAENEARAVAQWEQMKKEKKRLGH